MRELKNRIDVYFDLDGDVEGQVLYYGCVGLMAFIVVTGTIANFFL